MRSLNNEFVIYFNLHQDELTINKKAHRALMNSSNANQLHIIPCYHIVNHYTDLDSYGDNEMLKVSILQHEKSHA